MANPENEKERKKEDAIDQHAEQCNHWNDRLPGGIPLRPLQCCREQGHTGAHQCGDTSWGEALGVRMWTEKCDKCGGPATHRGWAYSSGGSFPVTGCEPCLKELAHDTDVRVKPLGAGGESDG